MNKNEKRFFQLYSSLQSGEKNYLKLFSVIEMQTQYNEAEIKKTFKGEKFIKQLTFTKEYLYQILVKSLNQYHVKSSADTTIIELIQTAKMLYGRALYKQCHKVLNKARQLASIHDKYALLLEILDIEKKLLTQASTLEFSEKELERILQEEMSSLDYLSELYKYWHLNSIFKRVTTRNWRPRNEEELQPLEKIINHSFIKGKEKPKGFQSTLYYYFIWGMYSHFKKDNDKAHSFFMQSVLLQETRPDYINENPERYMLSLYNLVHSNFQANKYRMAQEILEKMKRYFAGKKLNPDLEATIFNNYCISSLFVLLNTAQFEKAVSFVESTKDEFEKMEKMISDESKMVFCFNVSMLYFITNDFRKSLQWLNMSYTTDSRVDLNCFIRIIDLFIHFELQNHELLEYKVKSAHRFLSKRKRVYRFETLVLDFIKKHAAAKSKEQELNLYQKTKETIIKLSTDPFEREVLDRFDFVSWLDSKIESKPLIEILKAKSHPF